MKLIHNEDYYKLKCIKYFFDKGLIVCGNQTTPFCYHNIIVFYYKYRRWTIETDNLKWKDLYKNKERFLKEFRNMLNKVRLESKGE